MARQKLKKFEENKTRQNVLEPEKPLYQQIKGKWAEFFNNQHPITLELACGRGEYTVGLARAFPERNFIGVDMKGDRLWKGSGQALEENLQNAAFLRGQIHHLDQFFAPGEVAEIWLVFPDPRPKKKDARRRLTNPRFMELYKQILRPGGLFRLKTDNKPLFDYTLEVLEELPIENLVTTNDLYQSSLLEDHLGITTRYEQIFSAKGFLINYLKFQFI